MQYVDKWRNGLSKSKRRESLIRIIIHKGQNEWISTIYLMQKHLSV